MYFRQSHGGSCKLDVQEADFSPSYSSTESEMISLDAGLRMDGIPALDLSDLVIEVQHSSPNQTQTLQRVRRDPLLNKTSGKRTNTQSINPIPKECLDLSIVDCVFSNVKSSRLRATLYIFEDTEAVIKMIIKGRRPTMRHVSRTHRVALYWLFGRIYLDPKNQFKYVDTMNQLAAILTKDNFTRDEWYHLLCLINIRKFSSSRCDQAMPRRITGRNTRRKNCRQIKAWQGLQQRRVRVHLQARRVSELPVIV